MSTLVAAFILTCMAAAAADKVTLPNQCTCGYRDSKTNELFTESIISYFNETGVDQKVFDIRDYQNKNQRGWNTVYKQGASPSNVKIGNTGSLPWQDYIDGTSPSLEMWMDGFQFNHHSKGAELRSLRRDILYGTFRASMRSAHPWVGGSAMSMYLQFNASQAIHTDLLNMDIADQARVMQLIDGEWPEFGLAVNYTAIAKGIPNHTPPGQPWDFMEVGFDWTDKTIDFWVGNNRSRHVTNHDRDLTSVPETLFLSHWSTGDAHYMQGPPTNSSVANVRWIRAFFNSSLMTPADHFLYDQRCNFVEPCSVNDMTLRGSSAYSPAATVVWKQATANQHIRKVAGYVAAAFSVFGVITLINAIIRRGPWYKLKTFAIPGSKRASTQALRASLRQSMGSMGAEYSNRYPGPPGADTPAPGYASRPGGIYPLPSELRSATATPLPAYESGRSSPGHMPWPSIHSLLRPKRSLLSATGQTTPSHSRNVSSSTRLQPQTHLSFHDVLSTPMKYPPALAVAGPPDEDDETAIRAARARAFIDLGGNQEDSDEIHAGRSSMQRNQNSFDEMDPTVERKNLRFSEMVEQLDEKRVTSFMHLDDETKTGEKPGRFDIPIAPQDQSIAKDLKNDKPVPDAMTGAATAEPAKEQKAKAPNQPNQRIDYLAGLVAISCIMVTLRHFSLTFWPYVVESQGNNMHFHTDKWLSRILGPWVLTPLWIGPFFVTSCRFLAQRYLKTGKLNDIASKMLLRAPRMLIPVFIFMTLEYFFISLGLTQRLEWLPSVTYSTWPYVGAQPNFGVFLNEAIELSYFPINGGPEVINHYCVGVLWTIPVQLQLSFVVLLATVLIKDVKKPWKRMLFYTLSMIAGWYGSSWSACHWLGLLLADADITYNWVKWTQARWWALYPILTFSFLMAAATPLVLLFNSDVYYFPFMSWENAIHPDTATGRPMFEMLPSIWWAYPDYYAPNLAIFTFSLGLQVCVELSVWVQKALSTKVITFFHPHIMTIYLMHGFIFWSLGAYTAVELSSIDTPYWAILIIVAVVCYSAIFLLTVTITPLIEFATKNSIKNIWRWATEEPVPHRQTTAPFTKQLVLGRQFDETKGQDDEKEQNNRRVSTVA